MEPSGGRPKLSDVALVPRSAPVRNKPLCVGQSHRPWPVGRGWICLRCSHYERAPKAA